MNNRQLAQQEIAEEQATSRFMIICGIIGIVVAMVVFVVVSIQPYIETLNPVGNMIIKIGG